MIFHCCASCVSLVSAPITFVFVRRLHIRFSLAALSAFEEIQFQVHVKYVILSFFAWSFCVCYWILFVCIFFFCLFLLCMFFFLPVLRLPLRFMTDMPPHRKAVSRTYLCLQLLPWRLFIVMHSRRFTVPPGNPLSAGQSHPLRSENAVVVVVCCW